MRDSTENQFVLAEVGGGGGAPLWKFKEWREGAQVSIYRFNGGHGGDFVKTLVRFRFPEIRLVDFLAHGLANSLNLFFTCKSRLKLK